ncbi:MULTISPECIES: NaeI family type II restriction endonuclease [unclassified Luteococcus]|uniref:NaeI family type II restriction endonuclease n=1 Tax=unclassified Luteococcus TaxID=2639923 RepID=UPI00313DC25C
MTSDAIAQPGDWCQPDARRGTVPDGHVLEDPADDAQLQAVRAWLSRPAVPVAMTAALDDSIQYVLDGAHTGRFDLNDPEVDSDERSSVGTKAQYRILSALGLEKRGPLDTWIEGVPVDIKVTVARTWTIPQEAQCQLCLLVRIDFRHDRFQVQLMRTHHAWLNAGRNQDRKTTIRAAALDRFGMIVIPWSALPHNPLRDLEPHERDLVFEPGTGQARRLTRLFGFLPGTVIPRHAILTVCANRDDPLRRAREVKALVLAEHNADLLCGKWLEDRERAAVAGFALGPGDWLSLPRDEPARPAPHGLLF